MAILEKITTTALKATLKMVNAGDHPNGKAYAETFKVKELIEAVEVLTEALQQECICSKRLRISLVKDTCNVCIALEKVWGKEKVDGDDL